MSGLRLFKHQKDILELLTEHDRFLLLAEVGTGKTLPMLIHLSNLLLSGEINDALVVAPLSGLGSWVRDIEKLPGFRSRILKDSVRFVNYDKVSRSGSPWQKELCRSWGAIVLDEGHAISNPKSNRTKFFIGYPNRLGGISGLARYRYVMTGTLIANGRLEDVWAPMRFLFQDEWFDWREFKQRYLVTKQLPASYAEIVVGYRNKDDLLSRVGSCSFRVTKEDCLDLPEQLPDEVVYVPFSPAVNKEPFSKITRAIYDEALDNYIEAISMSMDNPLSRLVRLRQIASGHIKDAYGDGGETKTYRLASDKPRYARELIENNLPNKTVVFYNFKASRDALAAELEKAGISFVVLDGDQSDKQVWRRFQEDDAVKAILVQYQSGSSAIDLYASSYTIYYEPTDSSLLLEQSRARTHRNGQRRPCSYVFLLTEGSVEEDMYKRLVAHEDFTEKAYREMMSARIAAFGAVTRGAAV